MSEKSVLKGWFCPKARMWRILLHPHISNNNTDTLVLNGPTGTEFLNTTYTVPKSARILQNMQTNCDDRPAPDKAINNVYELPSTEPKIRYLHGATGLPTKATWLIAIRKGNYQSWPFVNSKNVNKKVPRIRRDPKGAHAWQTPRQTLHRRKSDHHSGSGDTTINSCSAV